LLRLTFSHFSHRESGELPSLLVNIGDCSGTEIKTALVNWHAMMQYLRRSKNGNDDLLFRNDR
jgi:hypothetical protein